MNNGGCKGTYNASVRAVCTPPVLQKDPRWSKRQGGRRLTRGQPRLVLREETFAWSRRPRSRAAGGSKDGSTLQRQTAPFSSRSLVAESTPRTSDQPWSARGRDPPGCCESRTAPASSAASFAWATSAPPPRATQLRRRRRRGVFFCSWSWLVEYSKDKHVQRSTYYCTRRSMCRTTFQFLHTTVERANNQE